MSIRSFFFVFLFLLVASACRESRNGGQTAAVDFRPNIVWLYVEDMSANWSCYGETTIETPNIDRLATQGERFTHAFATAPICSIFRSALITGMYQTTIGAHNHRSQAKTGKGAGHPLYHDSYSLPDQVPFLPRIFKNAGYYTVNGGKSKTDYNFVWESEWYDSNEDWRGRTPGQPFFAQIQLNGGKDRGIEVENPVDPSTVDVPPYYPDDEILREDWADYLNTVLHLDTEVGQIMDRLREESLLDSTVVFLFTDHGVSHLRDKQFLYDGGIHIPLIISGPSIESGKVRNDLVSHIDIAASSLYLAGIDLPEVMQAQPLYGSDVPSRRAVFSGRDRADETIDMIRSVRTQRFKLIRNFYPHKPHAQENRYKDGKKIIRHMRELYAEGDLQPETARYFYPLRPVFELYDLQNDPWEMNNLAGDPAYADTLHALTVDLNEWMQRSKDLGPIPEPILEELGKKHGSKYFVLSQPENRGLQARCIEMLLADETGEVKKLIDGLSSESASVRFWAAYGLGNLEIPQTAAHILPLLNDSSPVVQIAAARALCRMGYSEEGLQVLQQHLSNENYAVTMYAAEFIEDLGPELAKRIMPVIRNAQDSPFEFTSRIAQRLVDRWG
jgi:arylsulfatase A-like enzyme